MLVETISRLQALNWKVGVVPVDGRSMLLCAAYTPIATGPDVAEVLVPYSPADGMSPLVWVIRRLVFRVSVAGGSPSVRFEKSSGTGAFSAATIGTVTIGSGAYEGVTTSPSLGTVTSGDKIRFNVLALGTATGWTVIAEIG
jgi:hypothetical protein